ncbi:MAG: MFS transporter [Betaproteobacteria bacterium]|nr:MFS transporter [Betaproteobacteria bacterium]
MAGMRPAAARFAAFYFAYFAYLGAYGPYIALYFDARGFNAAQIALILALPQIARIFVSAFWGWFADRTGRRRAIVAVSCTSTAVGFALLPAARELYEVLVLVGMMGVFSAAALPIVEAMTLTIIAGEPGRYGPIRLWGSLGFVIAVLGTGALLDAYPAAMLIPVVVACAFGALACAFALPNSAVRESASTSPPILGLLRRADVAGLLTACFCMSVAHGTLYTFYTLYLVEHGYAKSLAGLLWTLGVLAEIAVFAWLPGLMRRFGLREILVASFLAAGVRFVAIGWGVESLAVLAAAQLLHAATFGSFHAASLAAVQRVFAGALQVRGQALYTSVAYGLGGSTGALVAGLAWESLGPAWTFTISSGFGFAGAALVWRWVKF